MRRRSRTAIAVLVAMVCALALPALAAAETREYVVDSVGDQGDASLGDEICAAAGGKCTLRAALQEANGTAEMDQILFEEMLFDGKGPTATITLASPLPAIGAPLYIHGTQCTRESGIVGPCAGIAGLPGASALVVENAPDTEIEWISITGAKIGIEVKGSNRVKVFSSWIGVALDGSADANGTGVFYGPGSDRARVGAFTDGLGNLFANNTEVGLRLFGASEAVIQGNRFGVGIDGQTPASNGKDIEVTSDTSGGDAAEGNEIGGRVRAESGGGPCDRECNVISGATSTGLDLQGDGGDEGPAVGTTVLGNYFGMTANGTGSAPNGGAAIRVGAAPETVIGGPRPGDTNRFSGGASAVEAGPGAPDLVVQGNRIGIGGAGQPVPAPALGLAVDSELTPEAGEAVLAGNAIRMDGGTGISQHGEGAWIAGNSISGAAIGIRSFGSVFQGNLVEGNTVTASAQDAILIENELNEIVGNRIAGAGRAGIAVRGGSSGVSGNVIGGDTEAAENEIVGAAGAAIEIENAASSVTTVARNRGSSNGGLFIDLVPAAAGAGDPNNGIAPPSILGAGSAGVVGSAEPGATVRVFRKQTGLAGEVAGFLGAATADEEGNWALAYGAPLPLGTGIAVGQTGGGASSELALATTKGAAPGEGESSSGDGTAGRTDRRPPRTAILAGPRARSAATSVRFRFASDERGTRFQCRLDRGPFRACTSPWRYRGLRPGRHVFAVRATDATGNTERTPAKRAFTVLGKR